MAEEETAGQLAPVEVPADFKAKGLVEVLRGKDYINHKGIVKLLHMHGVMCIKTEPVLELCSVDDMYFTFKCEIVGTRCNVTMCADASPANVNRSIASACSRMAETRAITRAGRTYLGLGQTTYDEMPLEEPPRERHRERQPVPQLSDMDHHESWEANKAACFRRLDELKMDYEVVKKVCAKRGWSKLSCMNAASRAGVLEWLGSADGLNLYRKMEG